MYVSLTQANLTTCKQVGSSDRVSLNQRIVNFIYMYMLWGISNETMEMGNVELRDNIFAVCRDLAS
jgi:hypothetical protein